MKRMAILAITLSCLAGLLCLAPGPETAWAQSSWNDGNSNWNTAGNWSPVGGPNSSTTDVSITNGTSSTPTTVTLDVSPSIQNLMLANYNTLSFGLSQTLFVYGTSISNDGQITINGGGGSKTDLVLENNVTLSGAGTLTMTVAGGGGSSFIEQGLGGLTLTKVNAGSTVQLFNNAVIQGGTLKNNGGAFFGTPYGDFAYLDGSTLAGAVTINDTYTSDLSTDTYLLGTINNKGNILDFF